MAPNPGHATPPKPVAHTSSTVPHPPSPIDKNIECATGFASADVVSNSSDDGHGPLAELAHLVPVTSSRLDAPAALAKPVAPKTLSGHSTSDTPTQTRIADAMPLADFLSTLLRGLRPPLARAHDLGTPNELIPRRQFHSQTRPIPGRPCGDRGVVVRRPEVRRPRSCCSWSTPARGG